MRLLFIFFMLGTINSFSQSKDCSIFKTGNFKYTTPELKHLKIIRNDTLQVEVNQINNLKMTGAIKWISKCKYTLTYKEVSDTKYNFIVGTKITIDISPTSKNTYKYLAYDSKQKISGEITKINK